MKRLLIILSIAFTCDLAYSPNYNSINLPIREPINPYLRLSEAISTVESGSCDSAYNHKEKATGRFQCRPIALRQYNKETGMDLKLSQMKDSATSTRVFLHHATKYHYTDIERISRTWNGGARGMKKESTKAYYKKVLAVK